MSESTVIAVDKTKNKTTKRKCELETAREKELKKKNTLERLEGQRESDKNNPRQADRRMCGILREITDIL